MHWLKWVLPFFHSVCVTVKLVLNGNSERRPIIGIQDQISLNVSQKYWRMPREHFTILSTFIKLQFVFKTFVLSIFEWLLKTGFTVVLCYRRDPSFACF